MENLPFTRGDPRWTPELLRNGFFNNDLYQPLSIYTRQLSVTGNYQLYSNTGAPPVNLLHNVIPQNMNVSSKAYVKK
jgi:hypothetical protein